MITTIVDEKVKAAIDPIENKLELQEKVNKDLYSKIQSLEKVVEDLKLEVKSQQQAFPALPEPQVHQAHQKHVGVEQMNGKQGDQSEGASSATYDLCAAARKIVGFSPIEPRMLDMQMKSYGARDIEEAKLMEIKSYLKCEMKILPSIIEQLNIVRIFPPAKENWNVLYVEFGSDKEVDIVFNHTRAITKTDHRVIRWTPKQMFDRYRAVQTMAYNIRKTEGLKTRVKIGVSDFLLCTRSPTSPVWHTRSLPNDLPAIDLSQSLPTPTSPPPGRPNSQVTGSTSTPSLSA